MLLKKVSKPAPKGFKRKKVTALGSYQEIKTGAKKIDGGVASFASNPSLISRE
jgi:hypothetical protein